MAFFVSCLKKLPANFQKKRTVQSSWKTQFYNFPTDPSGFSLSSHLYNKCYTSDIQDSFRLTQARH